MGSLQNRRQMVADHHDSVVVESSQTFEHRAHHLAVEILDGLDLFPAVSRVARLVRGLHVKKDKVESVKGLKGRLRFAPIIGVEIPCGAFHKDRFKPGVNADAPQEIDGTYDRALDAVLVNKSRKLGCSALAPEPDGVGLLVPLLPAPAVDRVML